MFTKDFVSLVKSFRINENVIIRTHLYFKNQHLESQANVFLDESDNTIKIKRKLARAKK